jgi:hypothetical protein
MVQPKLDWVSSGSGMTLCQHDARKSAPASALQLTILHKSMYPRGPQRRDIRIQEKNEARSIELVYT